MTLAVDRTITSAVSPRRDELVATFGPATHQRIDGLHVLRLKGSFYEMGRQHGHLLAREMREGPLPYYRSFVEKLFGGGRFGALGALSFQALQRTVGARVAATMPEFVLETIRGLADGSGISMREVLEGGTMPDSMVWLASRLMQIRRVGPAMHHRVGLGLGCTSAIAWGGATRDGRLLHARNFDYHGVAAWPRTQAVIFHEPDEGMKYVSVAAAGVALGGITAMNEAGLTLTVHQHMFTDRVKLGGTPIAVTGDVVMRKAETIDDAARILAEQTPIGCWTYVVTDGKRREVLCHEANPYRSARIDRGGAGEPSGTFGYANVYLDRELGDTELDLYGSYWRHNRARHERANALLAERAGAIDPEAMGAILADIGDGPCRVRGSIAMVLTVGSVVFRPEDGTLWVGNGEAPTSHNTFVPFSLRTMGHAPREHAFRARELSASERAAFEHFRRAYLAYVDDANVPRARREMAQACALEPRQSVYHALNGLLALNDGDPGMAATQLDEAIRLGHADEERVAAFYLWRARARDLVGRRTEALRDYRHVLGLRADRPVDAAARRGLARTYSMTRARRFHIDMSLGDVVSP
jgi:Acyl-coenzyme A:6-aminopenicillanic acid acyl-transferase